MLGILSHQQWQAAKRRAMNRQLNPLPTVSRCIIYLSECNYEFVGRPWASCYVFRDTTGKRPAHLHEIIFTLGELRHAYRHGF